MSLSRRAKRGIAIFNRIQSSKNNQKYHTKKMTIKVGPPAMDQNILGAALAAAEAIHASVQIVPDTKSNAVTPVAEGRKELDVPVQPEAGKEAAEGTPGGAQ